MKCPACQHIFSDLRDLCPQCLLDVRPFKKNKGVKVVNPNLSYSDLVERFEKKTYLSKINISQYIKSSFDATKQTKESFDDEVISLFEGAYHQMQAHGERSFELTAEQMQTKVNPEEIRLLFDLLTESLEEPEKIQRYVKDVSVSEKKVVESAALNEELQRYEKITEAPVYTLKASNPKRNDEAGGPNTVIIYQGELSTIGMMSRSVSLVLDAIVLFIISILSAQLVSNEAIRLDFSLSLIDLVFQNANLITLSVFLFIPCSIVYLLFSYILLNGTPGLRLVGGRITTIDGKSAPLQRRAIRALLAPVSFFCFGFLTVITQKLALHERISGTTCSSTT